MLQLLLLQRSLEIFYRNHVLIAANLSLEI